MTTACKKIFNPSQSYYVCDRRQEVVLRLAERFGLLDVRLYILELQVN